MSKLNWVIFGSLKIPSKIEANESAQFTSLEFAEISKTLKVRMFPSDSYTGEAVEHSTKTKLLELAGWDVKCR